MKKSIKNISKGMLYSVLEEVHDTLRVVDYKDPDNYRWLCSTYGDLRYKHARTYKTAEGAIRDVARIVYGDKHMAYDVDLNYSEDLVTVCIYIHDGAIVYNAAITRILDMDWDA